MNMDITLIATLITIILLASGIIMEYLTVLIFLTVMIVLHIASPAVIFSGFTSPAFWLTFAGLPLSMAVKQSGLADRIAHGLVYFCKGPYFVLVTGMALFGTAMAFMMPSAMSRMMLITPILMAFSEAHGFKTGSKGYYGLLLSGIFASYIAGIVILPANLPNIILMGAAASTYHLDLSYTRYLIIHFPVLGFVKILLLIGMIALFFHDRPQACPAERTMATAKFSAIEKRLMVYLTLLLVFWLLDQNISPAWPALLIAILCLLPGMGVINHQHFLKDANTAPLFYVGGLIGLSAVLNSTGVGALLGQKLIHLLPLKAGDDAGNFYLLSLTSAIVGIVTTSPGAPVLVTPFAATLAKMAHLPLMSVIMTQAVGFSMIAFPYQAPPLLVAMRLGHIPLKIVTLVCLSLFVLSVFILLPLDYAWWTYIQLL